MSAPTTVHRGTAPGRTPLPEQRSSGEPDGGGASGDRPSRARRAWRGRPQDPAWARPALLALLLGTGLLYLWDLGANGWANAFYSSAVQAGSVSWEAFFFGSSDAANAITVDKPPASLWVMALSVRVFGLSSWSILVPQALMGVATVGTLFAAVRRRVGPAGGLLAGLVLALTPVAALMFRFNNPDALLVLLMTLGAYAVLRGVESGRTRWMVLTGVLVGLGFLTKQLQVMLVVPAFAGTYLSAAPKGLGRRVLDLLAAGAALVVSAGWWLAVVELWPAGSRPYIGGSQTNSILELTLGYNGLGRLTGEETGSVGGGGSGGGWGETGITRLFTSDFGGQIAWLMPAALLLLVGALVLRGRRPRTDVARASLVVWGGWLLTTGLVFSYMAGIFHQYYTVALAPAVAAVVGTGAVLLWREGRRPWVRALLGITVAVTASWAFVLLGRSADFLPWLRWVVLVAGLVAGLGLVLGHLLTRRLLTGAAVVALVTGLAGPAAYAVQTVGTAHTGSIVTAGPDVAGSTGGPGGGGPGGGGPGGGAGGGAGGGLPGGGPQGGTGTTGGTTTGGTTTGGTTTGGTTTGGTTTGGTSAGGTAAGGTGGGGGMGGLLDSTTPSSDLVTALEADASDYTWVAAAVGSQNASGYQLATELPVMAVGGFNGSDPSPTLAQFQQDVADGQIHWFVAGSGTGGGPGGSSDDTTSTSAQITSWVEATFTAQTIGGTTVYDLSTGATG